jgi:hypothetical protein
MEPRWKQPLRQMTQSVPCLDASTGAFWTYETNPRGTEGQHCASALNGKSNFIYTRTGSELDVWPHYKVKSTSLLPLGTKEDVKCDIKHEMHNVTRFNIGSERQELLTADNYTTRHRVYMTHADVAHTQGCTRHARNTLLVPRHITSTETDSESH